MQYITTPLYTEVVGDVENCSLPIKGLSNVVWYVSSYVDSTKVHMYNLLVEPVAQW